MRQPYTPLDHCDQWHACTSCPLAACAYPSITAERRFREQEDTARALLAGGYSARNVAEVTGLQEAYVATLAGGGR